jgi:serine/threonine protein kinase
MELLTGGDLFSYLESRRFRLSEDRARKITHQIAIALYYMHNFGIAHRDIKPENILMIDNSDDADIKIVDFGLAKTLGPTELSNEAFGTLCYVAPEILLQKSYDKSVDLWSLGVMIHLMLSGTLPFDSEDDREIARKTIYQDVTFSNPVWTEISVQAKDLIQGKQ